MKLPKLKWLRLTEEINAIDNLSKTKDFIMQTNNDVYSWKWVMLSLHSTLYSFAICALKGTNPDNVVNEKTGHLISYGVAIKRCQDPSFMTMMITSKVLVLTDSEKESINRLAYLYRNNFEHYIPKTWSIEIHDFPIIVLDILSVIRFLALESGNYILLSKTDEKKIISNINKSRKYILKSKLYAESMLLENQI